MYAELVTVVINQEWRRQGDDAQLDGVGFASRLCKRGHFSALLDALGSLNESQVGDVRNTGVSAWVRIA
jgi:hypothetical protein